MIGTTVAVFIALVVGIVVGSIWGRKAEQKAVGSAVAEIAKIDAASANAVNRLRTRLAYLAKYL